MEGVNMEEGGNLWDRLKNIRNKLEIMEKETDVDKAIEFLEEATVEAESFGADLEEEK